ncbi:MAG TPA: metallophosphoesterase family protein [Gemmatimonadaceae bacterium]|nr:metallophosphoesterase family protein [Gemmatimonadaceae bacterium]
MTSSVHRIGLISDTHGIVRPAVHDVFADVELILHAGDVGDGVLDELATIAPVEAVFGNTDLPGAPSLAREIVRRIGGVTVHVSHGHELGSPTPRRLFERYPQQVLVYGHTHEPLVSRSGDRLVVNPGSAGPRRFHLTPSVALLRVDGNDVRVEIVPLAD